MKPTNRKKQARPQIRRERRESTINAMVLRKKLEKGTTWGGVGRGWEGGKSINSKSINPPCQPHPQWGRGKKKEGRERNRGGVGRKK